MHEVNGPEPNGAIYLPGESKTVYAFGRLWNKKYIVYSIKYIV